MKNLNKNELKQINGGSFAYDTGRFLRLMVASFTPGGAAYEIGDWYADTL